MNVLYHSDILGLIFNLTSNYYLTLVCKDIFNIIKNNSIQCSKCGKLTKIYNITQWVTDIDDDECHGQYTNKDDINYKTLKMILLKYPKIIKDIRPCKALNVYAIKHHPNAIKYMKQNKELQSLAVKYNGLALKYITEQDDELCQLAISNTWTAYEYVLDKNVIISMHVFDKNYKMIKHIPEEHRVEILNQKSKINGISIVDYMINDDISLFPFIPCEYHTDEVCTKVIKNHPEYIQYIKNKEKYLIMIYEENPLFFDKLYQSNNLKNNNYNNYDGYGNVAFGNQALNNVTIGNYNVCVGYRTGSNIIRGNNNIYLSHEGNVTDDATIRIGKSQQKNYQAGIYNNSFKSNKCYPVYITPDGQLGIKK